MKRPLALLAICVASATSSHGQTIEQLGGCASVAAFVATGQPDTATNTRSRYSIIIQCPQQLVPAIANGISAARHGLDERGLFELYTNARTVVDPSLSDVALDVASDRTATVRSRAYALALMLDHISFDSWPSVDEMGSGTHLPHPKHVVRTCPIYERMSHRQEQSGTLDAAILDRYATALEAIERDSTEDVFLRNIAACLVPTDRVP